MLIHSSYVTLINFSFFNSFKKILQPALISDKKIFNHKQLKNVHGFKINTPDCTDNLRGTGQFFVVDTTHCDVCLQKSVTRISSVPTQYKYL